MGGPAWQQPGPPTYNFRSNILQNKEEILCQLIQVSTRDSLHNWRNINVDRKLVSPRPHEINVKQIFEEYPFERAQNY
jgi:hypothetical protein